MFDGLFKPKFYKKCKQHIKTTKKRLDAIKTKRNAVEKYLKSDITYLLRNGFHINAYGRAEGLLVEQIRSSCYESIENFCGTISNNLSHMLKQRECPKECREAVPSLIYAAARFADLPELRNLRNLFTEKYGNSLECWTNEEFMEMSRPKQPTKEMELQLMQEIAKEFSIEWSIRDIDNDLETACKTNEDAFSRRKTQDDHGNIKEFNNASKGSESDLKSHGSKDVPFDIYKLQRTSSEDETTIDLSQDAPKKSSSSIGSVSEDEVDRFIPSPYLKSKTETKDNSFEEPSPAKKNGEVEMETTNQDHDLVVYDKPNPRSFRRRNLKPTWRVEIVETNETETDGVWKQETRRGLSSSREGNDSDEEKRIADWILMHNSKKLSPYDYGKPKANPKSSIQQKDDDGFNAGSTTTTRPRSRKAELAINPSPARASSMPPEPTAPYEAKHGYARAISLQPGMLSMAGHVHPKLPEYDDLAARIAALRGT